MTSVAQSYYKCQSYPSILLLQLILFRVAGGTVAYPSCLKARDRYTRDFVPHSRVMLCLEINFHPIDLNPGCMKCQL